MLSLSCLTVATAESKEQALSLLASNYSNDLSSMIANLVESKITSIDEIFTVEFSKRVMQDNIYLLKSLFFFISSITFYQYLYLLAIRTIWNLKSKRNLNRAGYSDWWQNWASSTNDKSIF